MSSYIKYLQSKGYLELENLQGVSGLKALRAEIIYKETFCDKDTITFKDLIKEIQY